MSWCCAIAPFWAHFWAQLPRGLLPISPIQFSSSSEVILPDDLCKGQVPSIAAAAERPLSVRSILPSIGLTKHRVKQLDSICLVREERASGHQQLAFQARPFVLCGLPLRRPPTTQQVHRRRNGKFLLLSHIQISDCRTARTGSFPFGLRRWRSAKRTAW